METFIQAYVKSLDISSLIDANAAESIIEEYFVCYQTDIKSKILFDNNVWETVCLVLYKKIIVNLYCDSFQSTEKIDSIICAIRDANSIEQKMQYLPLICVIDCDYALTKQLLEHGFFDELQGELKTQLSAITKCDISTTNRHPIYDIYNETVIAYHEAVKENNFRKILETLQSFELGECLGRTCFNQYMALIGFVLSKLDAESLILFCSQRSVFIFIKMFYGLLPEEKISIAYQIDNYLIKLEVIREIANLTNLSEENLLQIAKLVKQLATNDIVWGNILPFFLKDHTQHGVFWKASGLFFGEFSPTAQKIFINNIKIIFSNRLKNVNYIWEFWNNISTPRLKEITAAKLFWRMKKTLYVESPLNLSDSNIFNIVVSYLIELPEKGIERRVKSIINQLNMIDSIWFEDSLAQRRFFYTKVNILAIFAHVAYENKWGVVLNEIEHYINYSFFWKNEKYMSFGNLSRFDNMRLAPKAGQLDLV